MRALRGQVNLSFGWGTNLTNDFVGCAPAGVDGQLKAISLVCKVVEADGRPAVKLFGQSEQGAGAAGRGRALPADFRIGRHEGDACDSLGPKRTYMEEVMSQIAFPRLDETILARRDAILKRLAAILPPACLITDESGRRAFETDALTAYRRLPLAVALPRSTEEVARVMRLCRDEKVNVVPRGAGTSLSGGAIPQEDAVVVALTKMSRILEVNLADRYARVEAGVTNLAISEAVGAEGFFYAPDPSSQLACTIGGNIAMNSGGAHCLKYGVTTNNLLGVRLVTFDGEILDIGGAAMDAAGYDLLGLVCGSEGQLGIVTEATVRLIPSPEGARPVLFGFDSVEDASQCVAAIIGAGIVPVAMEYHGQARDPHLRELRPRRLSARCRGDADHRGRGRRRGDAGDARQDRRDRQGAQCPHRARIDVGDGERADLEGPQVGLRRDRPGRRLHLHGRHGPDRPAARGAATHRRDLRRLRAARRQRLSRRRRQYASADPLQRQRRGGAAPRPRRRARPFSKCASISAAA